MSERQRKTGGWGGGQCSLLAPSVQREGERKGEIRGIRERERVRKDGGTETESE